MATFQLNPGAGAPPREYYEITERIFEYLRKKGICSRRDYQGSAYKDTRVGDNADFDQMFIQRANDIIAEPYCAGYSKLKNVSTGQVVYPVAAKDRFKGELQKCLTALGLEKRILLREHSPAAQLDVSDQGRLLFSVDIVFTYDVKQNGEWNLFAPKSYSSGDNTWVMKSKVPEEKRHMRTIDQGHGVGRRAVKILKNIMAEEPTLQVLSGYVFETALFHEKGENPKPDEWAVSEVQNVLTRVLNRVADALEVGMLDDYFLPGRNILPSMKDVTRSNVVNRLRRLARTPGRLIPGSPDYAYDHKEALEVHAQSAGTMSESSSRCCIQ